MIIWMKVAGLVTRYSKTVYLLASCVPLRAVVPSLLTNSLKLLSEGKQGIQKRSYHCDKYKAQTKSPKLKLCPAFIVAAVREVLTLDNLLHNVICINAGVIHTAGLPLHTVLLPPVVEPHKHQQTED